MHSPKVVAVSERSALFTLIFFPFGHSPDLPIYSLLVLLPRPALSMRLSAVYFCFVMKWIINNMQSALKPVLTCAIWLRKCGRGGERRYRRVESSSRVALFSCFTPLLAAGLSSPSPSDMKSHASSLLLRHPPSTLLPLATILVQFSQHTATNPISNILLSPAL